MTTFVSDTFTEAGGNTALTSHVGETGATWAVSGSTWADDVATIYSGTNKVASAHSAAGYLLVTANGVPGAADYAVQVSLTAPASLGSGVILGLAGRVVSDTAGYIFLVGPGDGFVGLYRLTSVTLTSLTSTSFSFTPNTTYTVILDMAGSALVGKINGSTVLSTTDGNHTAAGRAGLFWEHDNAPAGDGSTSILVDNFTATDGTGGGGGGGVTHRRRVQSSLGNRRMQG